MFSRMRNKDSRFIVGVSGLRVCPLDFAFVVATPRNRWDSFATVCNRSCEDRMGVPMRSSAGVIIFGAVRRLVVSFRVAFRSVLQRVESRFAWQPQYFRDVFQKMCCSFHGSVIARPCTPNSCSMAFWQLGFDD